MDIHIERKQNLIKPFFIKSIKENKENNKIGNSKLNKLLDEFDIINKLKVNMLMRYNNILNNELSSLLNILSCEDLYIDLEKMKYSTEKDDSEYVYEYKYSKKIKEIHQCQDYMLNINNILSKINKVNEFDLNEVNQKQIKCIEKINHVYDDNFINCMEESFYYEYDRVLRTYTKSIQIIKEINNKV